MADTVIVFELKDRDGLGRAGTIETKRGRVTTPNLAPVLHPIVHEITAKEMKDRFGAEIVMTNSYTVWRSESRQRALEQGIHRLIDFDGPVMTDSGAFQSHVYGGADVTNQEIVTFQREIGSDFGTVLDVFSEPEHDRHRVEADMMETLARAREAAGIRGEMSLVGAVQGGVFADLREKCAHELSKVDVSIHAIGGVVPLMESYRFRDLAKVIIAAKRGLGPERPVHLFGAGHPMVFALAVLLGCDLFDSSSYDKYARAGRMMFSDGTRHLEEMESLPCDCPACSAHSAEDFRQDAKLLARHNLFASFEELRTVRNAIKTGELWELVERRCRSHPALLDALRELRLHADFLQEFEPPSRPGAFMYVGPESVNRPGLQRLRKLLQTRYSPPNKETLLIFPEGPKPYARRREWEIEAISRRCGAHMIVKSALGPVPIELDELYPFSQSIVPEELDVETLEASEVFAQQYVRAHGYKQGFTWAGPDTLNELPKATDGGKPDWDMMRVRAVADFQFGRGAADALLGGKIEFVKSSNTYRIRNVIRDGKHILSMRAHDGMFSLKVDGGRLLHRAFIPPALRVVVETDTAEFNRQGKNVFAKFVLDCDSELRPGDECLVVDQKDELVAVGRLFMTRGEMLAFERGVAVHVREGVLPPP